MSEEFFDAGQIDDFPHGKARVVQIDGVAVAVFRLSEGWRALKDACPHMGSSLALGRLRDGRVICHWHNWSFDLVSGESDSRRKACARVYEVRIDAGHVWLRPPATLGTPAHDDEDDAWMRQDPDSWFKS